MEQYKTSKELVGKYLECTYNNFSDFWKVEKATPKTLTLKKVAWHCVAPEKGEIAEADPTYCTAMMQFENGKPVYETKMVMNCNCNPAERKIESKPITKRCKVFKKDGGIAIKTPSWEGFGSVKVCARNDEEAKAYRTDMYWG